MKSRWMNDFLGSNKFISIEEEEALTEECEIKSTVVTAKKLELIYLEV